VPLRPRSFLAVLASLVVLAAIAPTAAAVGNGNGSGDSGPSIVRGPDGVLLPVMGTFARVRVVSSTCGHEVAYGGGEPVPGPVDVVLDPGHGGPETGSVGANGLVERDLNLAVALRVEAALTEMGHTVALTRRQDLHMPIRQRTRIVRSLEPRAFVSIHHNGGAVRRSDTPGTETFHQVDNADSQRLAGLLFEEVQTALSGYWVPWVRSYHQGVSSRLRPPRTDTYGVLRLTRGTPAAIVEGLYMSNPPEAELIALPEVQEVEARAIATAIDRFLTTDEPGSGFKDPFYDPHTTGTGTAQGCVDRQYSAPVDVRTGFTDEEYASLEATARRMGRSVAWLVKFGVYTLKFLGDLPGATVPVSLSADERPDAYGPVGVSITWDQAEHAVLARMADAYGLTRTEVQKLGAVLMVFLVNLPAEPTPDEAG